MTNFTGVHCPICGRPFTENDDVVVCPECGAPYHRGCFEESGKCIFPELHREGKSWQPPQVEAPPPGSSSATKRCPRCGKMNPETSLFCDQCGQSLIGPGERPGGYNGYNGYGAYGGQQAQQPGGAPQYGPFGPMGGPAPVAFDPMGGVVPAEGLGGAPAGVVAKLVQGNTPYYLPVFRRYAKERRSRFNFCAFLFTGGWMLYRKMYKEGILFGALSVLLYAANLAATNLWFVPLLQSLADQAGSEAASLYGLAADLSGVLLTRPASEVFLSFLPSLLQFLQLRVAVVAGAMGNRLYYQHCVSTVQEIHRENTTAAEFDQQLQLRGGVNTTLAVVLLVCAMFFSYLPALFF